MCTAQGKQQLLTTHVGLCGALIASFECCAWQLVFPQADIEPTVWDLHFQPGGDKLASATLRVWAAGVLCRVVKLECESVPCNSDLQSWEAVQGLRAKDRPNTSIT